MSSYPMCSLFLVTESTFWDGLYRMIDLGNNLDSVNDCPTPEMADAMAIYSDFRMTGLDIEHAMEASEPDLYLDDDTE